VNLPDPGFTGHRYARIIAVAAGIVLRPGAAGLTGPAGRQDIFPVLELSGDRRKTLPVRIIALVLYQGMPVLHFLKRSGKQYSPFS
jgi:hypothetical protein